MQVVQVYLQQCRRNSLLECAPQPKIAKKTHTKTLYFRGSRLFKIIDSDTIKKLITSACYDKQYVCVYLQLFLHKMSQAVK